MIAAGLLNEWEGYLETAGVLKEVLLEEDLTAGHAGYVRAGARGHHNAALDFESSSADILELDDPRVARVTPWVEQHFAGQLIGLFARLNLRYVHRHPVNFAD